MSNATKTPTELLDLQDERLSVQPGLRGEAQHAWRRIRGGDLGALPVVIGLVVIAIVFQSLNPFFLSSSNLVNLTLESAAVGTIALGVVLVLLLGQIDLSVGSVSGLSAAVMAVTFTHQGWPLVLSISVGIAVGAGIGLVYGALFVRFGVPSFVITLAGLLAFLGFQLYVLGTNGSVNIPFDSWIVQFAQQMFLPPWVAYVLAVAAGGSVIFNGIRRARHRDSMSLSSASRSGIIIRGVLLTVALSAVTWYLALTRGVAVMFVFFIALVILFNFLLTRTTWGRSVFAIGGNVEAARRAGIRVNQIYISVFLLCSTLAAVGGILAAARLASANPSSGGGDVNLNAIAAAVIGGTSLFGGRGSAYSALLGILVISAISSGLTLLSLDSAIRFMITGAVLLVAVIIDSVSRRSRAASGTA
jgi:ABC-type xylose transport system permease subunit